MRQQVSFPSGNVDYWFEGSFAELWESYDRAHAVIITNEHIARLYARLLDGLKVIVLPPGESTKDIATIGLLAKQLLQAQAGRNALIVGLGGGVITDIAGFIASVYVRGVQFGFVPTTLLGMVDAAVGGKNGVNVGMYKNSLGTVTQPKFILYDAGFLNTLPDDEWSNGFAEIIKYACIFDSEMFDELATRDITYYREHADALEALVKRCVDWKNHTVQQDEKETGPRKLLNFGHTAAHAIENLYEVPHGKAVGIGMVIACMISAEVAGLNKDVTEQLKHLLARYHLPVHFKFSAAKAMEILKMDKKRTDDAIDYIVLERIGKAAIRALPFGTIEKALIAYEHND